ncbi:MAG TPA: DUF3108 domain-containing protein [Steroidobacteraceae bacterium]|jgi:hypothetical protein|nr:DUF3108 domain-containing protein [Steroidobacteraceae bacterium]
MRLPEAALLVGLLASAAVHADPVDLKPFSAHYGAEWKGMSAASSTLSLRRAGPDTYVYETLNKPRGLFRLALPDSLAQASTFKLVDGKVVPMEFHGSDEKERPIDLRFDWTQKRVTGVAKGRAVDLELKDGAQDPMSLQIASLRKLANGDLQDHVWLVDNGKIKEYELRREGTAEIDTALGRLETVIYTSKNVSGDRLTRTWVAPALGYLPVKAERVRGSKVEFTLRIETLEN